MYKSFEIRNFRGFRELSLEGFRRINLITGKNNVGKTAVLEAIFLHTGAFNPELTMVLANLRGITQIKSDVDRENETPWDSFFYNYASNQPIRLSGVLENNEWEVRISHVTDAIELSGLKLSIRHTYEKATASASKIPAKVLKLEHRRKKGHPQKYFLILDRDGKKVEPLPPASPFPSRFHIATTRSNVKEEAERFARIQLDDTKTAYLKALSLLESRLKDVEVVIDGGEPMLHGDIGIPGRRFIPMAMMGDGLNRLSSVLLLIANAAGGVLLVDEMEIGWHHASLHSVWAAINQALEFYKVQLFCTTHSYECVKAAHAAFLGNEEYPLSVFRLERTKEGTIIAVTYDQETLKLSLEQAFDVR